MKSSNAVVMGGLVVLLTGCATAPKVVVQDRVGPCHRVAAPGTSAGSLRVYSARERVPVDVNTEAFLWNNDFGRNEFLYDAAYSDYRIFDQGGTAIRTVRNSLGVRDEGPTTTTLSEGSYSIEAQAEDLGRTTRTVVVPLVIEAGQMTTVHLEPEWSPADETLDASRLVRLSDGRIVGCRADHVVTQNPQMSHLAGSPTDSSGRP